MKILVCNDDGIQAEGIISLALSLYKLGEILVVAPDMERSATGHAITMHQPLRIRKVPFPKLDIESYSVNGTPADCIKIGVDVILKEKPALIVSGINRGANLGTDVLYSGTVSAAIEGSIIGVPSVAISLASFTNLDYTYAGEVAFQIGRWLLNHNPQRNTLLNINVPNVSKEQIKGFRATKLGIMKYSETYIKREDPRGGTYYWLAGEVINDRLDDNTDIAAVRDQYVSITPMHFDLTDYTRKNYVNELIHSIQF